MPRFEKWLTSATANAPTDSVARAALQERLLAASYFLKKSVGDADEAEAIHQLRVWTRRAAAALALFDPALPSGRAKRMKKLLHKLRRRAGGVRDCDIHLNRLNEEPTVGGKSIAVPRRVARELKLERRAARQRLKALRRRLQKHDELAREIERLLAKVAWPKRHSSREGPPFGDFCRRQIQPLGSEFFRLAEEDLHDNQKLHALRIAGKRLRYALELAPAAMPAGEHHKLYDGLNEVQDRLGEVCDQLTAIDHVQKWLADANKKSHRRRLAVLLRREQRRLAQLRAKLLRWWNPKRRRELKKHWQAAISRER